MEGFRDDKQKSHNNSKMKKDLSGENTRQGNKRYKFEKKNKTLEKREK